jgi:hypothetical protein
VGINEIHLVVDMTSFGYYEFASRDSYLAKVIYILQCKESI